MDSGEKYWYYCSQFKANNDIQEVVVLLYSEMIDIGGKKIRN
jgi:hypothetical protein